MTVANGSTQSGTPDSGPEGRRGSFWGLIAGAVAVILLVSGLTAVLWWPRGDSRANSLGVDPSLWGNISIGVVTNSDGSVTTVTAGGTSSATSRTTNSSATTRTSSTTGPASASTGAGAQSSVANPVAVTTGPPPNGRTPRPTGAGSWSGPCAWNVSSKTAAPYTSVTLAIRNDGPALPTWSGMLLAPNGQWKFRPGSGSGAAVSTTGATVTFRGNSALAAGGVVRIGFELESLNGAPVLLGVPQVKMSGVTCVYTPSLAA